MRLSEEFERSKRSPEASKDFLLELIERTNRSLASMGPYGQKLLENYKKAGTKEEIIPDDIYELRNATFHEDTMALFASFSREDGFINEIYYGPPVFEDYAQFFRTRLEEMFHAIQYNTIAALHATDLNLFSKFSLSPRSNRLASHLMEKSAHVIAEMMTIRLRVKEPKAFLNPERSQLYLDLHSLIKRAEKSKLGSAVSILSGLADHADLPSYASSHAKSFDYARQERKRLGIGKAQYVRLGLEDIEQLSTIFDGLSLVEKDRSMEISWAERFKLSALTLRLTGSVEESLPTLYEALTLSGCAPEDFISFSKQHGKVDKSDPNFLPHHQT